MIATIYSKLDIAIGNAPACNRCGELGVRIHYDDKTWCFDCIKIARIERKKKRQAELDALPRCEFCHHRGTWKVGAGNPALLCGWCYKKAQNHTVKSAGWFMAMHTYTGDEIRAILTGIEKLKV